MATSRFSAGNRNGYKKDRNISHINEMYKKMIIVQEGRYIIQFLTVYPISIIIQNCTYAY